MVHSRRLWRLAAALLGVLAALCTLLAFAAGAEDAPQGGALAIEFTIDPGVMVAPEDVTMTFVIENQSDAPVQNIYLSSADGMLSEPVGQLEAGERQTLVRPHTVTQEELDAGEIDYTISHDSPMPGGEKVAYSLSAKIVRGEAQPSVSFTRQLSSDFVPQGGLVTITYKIANTGNVALGSLRIRDTLGDFTGRLEQLDVGDVKTFISRVTLSEASESTPVLEYAVPSGGEFAITLDPAPIGIAADDLAISFSVGQVGFNRDTADAILILTNRGNLDYYNITVLDDVYGGVIADAISLPSGSAPREIPYTYPLRGDGEYRWRITGMNNAGQRLDQRTDTLTLPMDPEAQAAHITLEAHTQTPRISRPGRVTFDFTIQNDGPAMGLDARLYEANRGDIRRLAVIAAGAPTLCSASYDVGTDADFVFSLDYTDAQGRQHTVTSSPIQVAIAPDGVNPQRAEETPGELEGGSVKLGGNSSTFIILLIIAGAALTVMLTILAVTSIRARRERMKRLAAEKQRIKAELGKTGSFPAVKQPRRGGTKRNK